MHKHIEVIAHFDKLGKVIPYRIKYEDAKNMNHVIRVDRVIKCSESRHNGNVMLAYICDITNKGTQKQVTLYYEVEKCRWSVGVG